MHSGPLRASDKGIRGVSSSGTEERAAPGGEVVERQSRGARYDAVEFFRKVLGSLETLSPAGRAAEVVRLVMSSAIEIFGDLLANDSACVEPWKGELL